MKIFPIDHNKSKEKKELNRKKIDTYGRSFETGKFQNVKMRSGSVKFSSLYRQYSPWKRYLLAILIGLLMAVVVQFLVKNTGLYNTGLSAIIQGFSRLIYSVMVSKGASEQTALLTFNLLFWVVYLVCNIPLFIFAYFKIGKTFSKLTFVYLLVNALFGFGLSSIPDVDKIFIFGKTIQDNADNILVKNHVYVLPFYFDGNHSLFDTEHDPVKAIFLFLYSIGYGILSAFGFALLYILGSCSAGLDIVSIFYATKKNKNIGSILVIINTISMIIGATMGSYISAGLISNVCWSWQFFFSSNLFASALNIIIFGFFLNRLFPLNKSIRVEIFSSKIKEIREVLYQNQYTHPLSIYKVIGGYTLKEHEMLLTICMNIELPKLVRHIRTIDETCLITATHVDDIDGAMKVYQQGSIEL